MEDLIEHVPEDLPSVLSCPVCKKDFEIPWLKSSQQPFIPVFPNDFHPVTNNKVWVPSGIQFSCTNCGAPLHLEFPRVKKRGEVHLFGDESFNAESLLYTYTLVGADPKLLADIETKLHNVKLHYEPCLEPASWISHMKDLWSQDNRKRHAIFKNWDFQKVRNFVKEVNDLIKTSNDQMFLFNMTISKSYPFNKTTIEKSKLKAYCNFILAVVEYLTTKGAQPHLFFDSERPSSTQFKIHQWAKDAFQNAQRKLLYTYISRGIQIPEPLFIKPGSHPCSEIADHISYWIRKYHMEKERSKSFVDPKEFGTVTYFGFSNTGELIRQRQIGYPWDEFYGRKRQ